MPVILNVPLLVFAFSKYRVVPDVIPYDSKYDISAVPVEPVKFLNPTE